jgi:hypothetical protein
MLYISLNKFLKERFMKTIKNHVFTALTIILLATAFFVTGCINADHEGTPKTQEEADERKKDKLPEGRGAILLKFGDDARSTIMPDISLSSLKFSVFISFTEDGLLVKSIKDMTLTQVQDPILLIAGKEYLISVFGYVPGSETASFFGKAEVTLTETTKPVNINMEGVVSEGTGKFTYKITPPVNLLDEITLPKTTKATMIIQPLSASGTSEQIETLFDASVGNSIATFTDLSGKTLKAGYYYVEVKYERAYFRTSAIAFVLHIYPALTSYFEFSRLSSLVKLTNLSVFFDANDGRFSNDNDRSPALIIENVGDKIPIDKAGYNGEDPTSPADEPEQDFGGWYKDRSCYNEWNFDEDRVWVDGIILYAKWAEKSHYTVTFHANTSDQTYNNSYRYSIEVPRGTAIPSGHPEDPIKPSGQKLTGWFEDNPGITWDFSTPIWSGLNLYAKWENEENKEIVIDNPGNIDVEDEGKYVVILNSSAWYQGFRLVAPKFGEPPQPVNNPVWSIVEYPAFGNKPQNDLHLTGVYSGGVLQTIYDTMGLRKITVVLTYDIPSLGLTGVKWTFELSFREE